MAGDFEGAGGAFEAFLQRSSDNAECWFLFGVAQHGMRQFDAARGAFLRAAELDCCHLQSRIALAMVYIDLGNAKAAIAACLDATVIAPDHPDAWFSLGVAQEANSAKEAALAAYDHALRLAPDHHGAIKNKRALLLAVGRFDEAVVQSRTVARKRPYSVDAQFDLGESLSAAQDFSEAARVFGRAASLAPRNARVALHYGFALAQLERFAEAQAQLDHAANLDSALLRQYRQSIFGAEQGDAAVAVSRLDARVLVLLRHFDQIERCNWAERDAFISQFSGLLEKGAAPALNERALGFRALAMGLDPALQFTLARGIAAGIEAVLPEAMQLPFHAVHHKNIHSHIRIGYISASFRAHPVALLLGDLFSRHDRNRFEVIGYSIGSDDGGEPRRKIAADCDNFVDLVQLNDGEAAQRIATDSIDVLVDITGYLDQARPGILARRPAPVQVSWMDYLATTGASWIDYVVADAVSLPDDLARHFSEAVIRMPRGIYLCAYADRVLRSQPDRSLMGLPEDGLVLGALHNHYKIEPTIFAIWMKLLLVSEKAVLWLLDGRPESKAALRAGALKHGVAPARLVFAPKVPHEEHLARLQVIGLSLDTPQCNGGTTTADALAAGVPVLTCAGGTLMQRVAASLLHAAGQDELITYDLVQYESLARDLVLNPRRLQRARERIAEARATALFFSPEKWLRHFESGIQQAWDRHCAGLPPGDIKVEA